MNRKKFKPLKSAFLGHRITFAGIEIADESMKQLNITVDRWFSQHWRRHGLGD